MSDLTNALLEGLPIVRKRTSCHSNAPERAVLIDRYPSQKIQHSACLRFFCDVVGGGRSGWGERCWLVPTAH